MSLTQDELARLEQLEDQQARGKAVAWDEPKTVRGIVIREVETVTFTNDDGTEQTKRVVTLRTEAGLEAIFEGPVRLNDRLFNGERRKDDPDPLGPPKEGDLLIVTYRGEKPTASGRNVKDFDVFRGSAETPDQTLLDDPGPAERPPHTDEDAPPADDDDIPF
jgi:hypothetical protein